jgi:alpha-ketoglutarate-dependent taurine dioxygenase|tara:strand:+ start:300 stop:1076 length:777 start_codon:yes stop_codon:yes gene_type:complete
MIKQYTIKEDFNKKIAKSIIDAWMIEGNKVFHLISNTPKDRIRDFYEKIGNMVGKYKLLAEDVNLGDRSNQQANKIWMDVRYDSNINDAYRHSSNPQPLHTDGSYNPNFPNATIMCCVTNTSSGGETIFLDLKKLVEILKQDDPELLEFLFTEDILHERTNYTNKKKILFIENKKLKINFNYFCVSKKNSEKSLKNVEKFFKFINTSEKIKKNISPIKLNAGEAVFWKDSEILHGRNSFIPKKDSDRFLWKAAIEIGR